MFSLETKFQAVCMRFKFTIFTFQLKPSQVYFWLSKFVNNNWLLLWNPDSTRKAFQPCKLHS